MTDTTYITPAGIECRMLNTDVVKMPNTNLVEMKLEGVRDSATISLTLRGGFSVRPEFGCSGHSTAWPMQWYLPSKGC